MIGDLLFVFVWFFCATFALAAGYAALVLTAPFLDLVTNTQHVASFRSWWRAKKALMISQIESLKGFREAH